MKQISEFSDPIQFLLCDIDDTLTHNGLLPADSYSALWRLRDSGIHIVPVTGRPAGWCEMIARQWPVSGVVGENGAFAFRLHKRKMLRLFARTEQQRLADQKKLQAIKKKIAKKIPQARISSDQFSRLFDLAVDFCEDVRPLSAKQIQSIVEIFEDAGATAKVSSIHVNGWFGRYNKLTMSLRFLKKEFGLSQADAKTKCAFVGDSPNDGPMWAFFPNGFCVGDLSRYKEKLDGRPTYQSLNLNSKGFVEIAEQILKSQPALKKYQP